MRYLVPKGLENYLIIEEVDFEWICYSVCESGDWYGFTYYITNSRRWFSVAESVFGKIVTSIGPDYEVIQNDSDIGERRTVVLNKNKTAALSIFGTPIKYLIPVPTFKDFKDGLTGGWKKPDSPIYNSELRVATDIRSGKTLIGYYDANKVIQLPNIIPGGS